MSSHSTVFCDLKPITKREGKLLREIVPNSDQREVYRTLRETQGSASFSYGSLADELGFPSRDSVVRALNTLMKVGLVTKEQRGDENRFHILPVTENGAYHPTFRGASSIAVTSVVKGLSTRLDEGEEEQLYLALRDHPREAALYIHLRSNLRKEITKRELARRFLCQATTLNSWLDKLSDRGLVDLQPASSSMALSFAAGLADGEAERADVQAWLRSHAAVPTIASAISLLLAKGSQSALIIDFYEKAMMSRKAARPSLIVSTGSTTVNERVARNLAKKYTFKELMPALIFFVYDWAGEAVDQYGRTLMTFQKNLPAILEEANQALETPTYVQHKMKRYGLDQFFPVPEVVQRKKEVVITNPEEIARRAEIEQLRAEVIAEMDAEAAAKASAA